MLDTINHFAGYLEKASFFSYPVSIFLGFLAGMAAICCFLPIVPMALGFIGGQKLTRKRLFLIPLYVMLGSVIVLGILGIIVSFAGLSLQKYLGPYWLYVVGILCVVVGLFELQIIKTGGFNLPQLKNYKGFWSPLLFGMVAGGTIGIGSACCVPILPIVLTYAGIQGKPIHGGLILIMFAIGQSIPVFAVGLFSSALSKAAAKWSHYVRKIAGVLLIAVGVYLIGGQFYRTRIPDEVQPQGLISLTTDKDLELSPALSQAQSEPLVSPAADQQLKTKPSSDKAKSFSWQDKLNKCSQEQKFTFLFVDKGETSDGQAIRQMLQNVVDGHPGKVIIAEADFSKEKASLEGYFKIKLKELPVVFVIAPNGAITGIFDKKITKEMTEQSLVSDVEADLLLSLQKGQVVFLCLYKNQSDELEKVKAELGAIEKLFKGVGVARYLNTNDTSVSPLAKKLPPFNSDLTTVFMVVPPGRIISRFEGSQISRPNLLTAFQSACGSGCSPSGCGPR